MLCYIPIRPLYIYNIRIFIYPHAYVPTMSVLTCNVPPPPIPSLPNPCHIVLLTSRPWQTNSPKRHQTADDHLSSWQPAKCCDPGAPIHCGNCPALFSLQMTLEPQYRVIWKRLIAMWGPSREGCETIALQLYPLSAETFPAILVW